MRFAVGELGRVETKESAFFGMIGRVVDVSKNGPCGYLEFSDAQIARARNPSRVGKKANFYWKELTKMRTK